MPRGQIGNIRRRFRQADAGLKRACQYMAEVYVTVKPQHPDIAEVIRRHLIYLDLVRQDHLILYKSYFGGTQRGLWRAGDLDWIVATAPEVYNPDARD